MSESVLMYGAQVSAGIDGQTLAVLSKSLPSRQPLFMFLEPAEV